MTGALRERAREVLSEVFGEPVLVPTPDGLLYRWTLRCADGNTVRLTLDSPEFPHLAHVIVSDPAAPAMLSSVTCEHEDEVRRFAQRLHRRQCG